MDDFLQLNWGIKEPYELDNGPDFIPEEELAASYVFTGLPKEKGIEISKNAPTETVIETLSVPGQQYSYKTNTISFLNTIEHEKCLIILKLMQANKKPIGRYEQSCLQLYNNCHQRILEENEKYLRFAQKHFENSNKMKDFKLRPLLKIYAESLWKHKLKRCKDYKQFYKGIDMLPYSYKEDEEPIELLHVGNLLELGTLAKFSGPTLLKPYFLKRKNMPRIKMEYHSNQSVSKDANINQLVISNKIDIVISSSGLTRLLNFTETKTSWDIPVVIKEAEIQNSDGTKKTKNVIFIDKPLPSQMPTIFELNEKCTKIALKNDFCDIEAFSFPNLETPISSYNIYNKQQQTQANDKKDHLTQATNSDDAKVQLPSNEGNDSKDFKRKLDELDENQEKIKKAKPEHCEGSQSINSENGNGVHHNVSYRLWKLQLKNEQCELMKAKYQTNSIHVLVRCKLDACESGLNGQLQPINVTPKIEYHLEYGGGIATRRELVKQWVYAHFRPYSQVRRIRTHYHTGEVIAIENCTPQKIAIEANTHYKMNPHLGLGVLYKIFSRLVTLNCGNYILHHLSRDGAFVALLREVEEKEDSTFNLYEEYEVEKCHIDPNLMTRWHPIDVNFILPRHITDNQMPGMFKPCLIRKFTKNNKKKKGKKKKGKTQTNKNVIVKKENVE